MKKTIVLFAKIDNVAVDPSLWSIRGDQPQVLAMQLFCHDLLVSTEASFPSFPCSSAISEHYFQILRTLFQQRDFHALRRNWWFVTWKKQEHLKGTRSLSLNFIFLNKTFTVLNNRGKCIVYSGKNVPKLRFKTPTECVKPAKCFIVHKLLIWFYHTDGKRCAVCLTSDDEAVGRGTNDFARIGTFEIISRHCYLFI